MTSTTAPARPSRLVRVALALVVVPAGVAATLTTMLAMGPLGLLVGPSLCVAALYLYRLAVRSTHSDRTRVAAREAGAAVLAIALGLGVWVAMMVLGVVIGVMPFLTGPEDYPHAAEWEGFGVLAGVAAVPVSWWLLRRWADARTQAR